MGVVTLTANPGVVGKGTEVMELILVLRDTVGY